MALLVLIVLAQLVILCLILALVNDQATTRASERLLAAQAIQRTQAQAVRDLFMAEARARGDVVDGRATGGDRDAEGDRHAP